MAKFIELNKKKGGILVNVDAIKTVIPLKCGYFVIDNTSTDKVCFSDANAKIVLDNTDDLILAEETYEEIKEMLKC